MDKQITKFIKVSSRADYLGDKDMLGGLVKDVGTGALGGAVAGGGIGAALGAGGGLLYNMGEWASFGFKGDAKKLSWLAGDLQDKLNMIDGATDNPEIKGPAKVMGAGFKDFIDHYIRDGRIDSLRQDNIFANKAAVGALSNLDAEKAMAIISGDNSGVQGNGIPDTTTPEGASQEEAPAENPVPGGEKSPSMYDEYGWDERIGKPGEAGNIYGLNPVNTNVDEYQFNKLKENNPNYKWISQGQSAYLNNIDKIRKLYPNLSLDEAMVAHLKKNQQSEQFAQYIMNELKNKEAQGLVPAADVKFVGRIVTSAVREFNNLYWVELSELLDDYGMYHLSDKVNNRVVIAADYGPAATNVGLGLTAYPFANAFKSLPARNRKITVKTPGILGNTLQKKFPKVFKTTGNNTKLTEKLLSRGNILKGLLGAGVSIGTSWAWDKLSQRDKNYVVKKSLNDAKDIVNDMRVYTKQLNSAQKQVLNYALRNMEKFLNSVDRKLYSASATTSFPWQQKTTAPSAAMTAQSPAPPPWEQ